jgi:hypothetical protein
MVPTTQSDDSAALEHILTIILSEPPPSAGSSNPPFRVCFAKAGVLNASDFISVDPSDYGIITFAAEPSGFEDQILSLIQVKKINSLFSWFHQVTPAGVNRWMELDLPTFQAWRSLPPAIPQGASPASTISLPISAIYNFRKSVKRSVSDYQVFKEDRLWHSPGIGMS